MKLLLVLSNLAMQTLIIKSTTFLKVLGNHSEFRRVSNLLIENLDFDTNLNVSVFESNIRGTVYEY